MSLPAAAAPPLVLGFALGLRHALDPDHLVAMSTLVSRERNPLRSAVLGGTWGLGHCLALFTVGLVVVLAHVPVPEPIGHAMEVGIGFMLIGLGATSLLLGAKRRAAISRTAHDVRHRFSRRPFLVGIVHGLAGSGALALLVLATIPSPVAGLLYIAIFGFGAVGGMMGMSLLLSLPFALASARAGSLEKHLVRFAAVFSVLFGLYYVYQVA
ncbi:MAG: hypothetical protein ACM3JJ_02360 [Hyphomicrobiales bacterium]